MKHEEDVLINLDGVDIMVHLEWDPSNKAPPKEWFEDYKFSIRGCDITTLAEAYGMTFDILNAAAGRLA